MLKTKNRNGRRRSDQYNYDLINKFWLAINDRDWEIVFNYLAKDFFAVFPQSKEHFPLANYIKLNTEYPGSWSIKVENIFCASEWVITEVNVKINERVDKAISFFRIDQGLIVELREYWPEPFPIPNWRLEWQKASK